MSGKLYTEEVRDYIFKLAQIKHKYLNAYIDGIVLEDYDDYCIIASKNSMYRIKKLEKVKLEPGSHAKFLCRVTSRPIGLEFRVEIEGMMAQDMDYVGTHFPKYLYHRYVNFWRKFQKALQSLPDIPEDSSQE